MTVSYALRNIGISSGWYSSMIDRPRISCGRFSERYNDLRRDLARKGGPILRMDEIDKRTAQPHVLREAETVRNAGRACPPVPISPGTEDPLPTAEFPGTVSIGSGSPTPHPDRLCCSTDVVELPATTDPATVLFPADEHPFGAGAELSLLVFSFFFLRSLSLVRFMAGCGSGAMLLACVEAFPPYPLLPDELLPLWRDLELPLQEIRNVKEEVIIIRYY
uniref:Uncharacterized protein n=1 Tax=Anopheles maculatus TaxID=74869 RepID=A0A182T3E7_9DIPT